MTESPLILRTHQLYISPVSADVLSKLGEQNDNPDDEKVIDSESRLFGSFSAEIFTSDEKRYLKKDLCAGLAALCEKSEEDFIWNTVWRISLRGNTTEQVGLFRFCGPQEKGRVRFELVIFPEYRHMGYAGQLIKKMTDFAFSKNDVYYLYSNVLGTENEAEYESILRHLGYTTQEEIFDPFADLQQPAEDDYHEHQIPELLMMEGGVTAYSSVYVMIGLAIGMLISIFSGLLLEGLAAGLLLSLVFGTILDQLEIKHRKKIIS